MISKQAEYLFNKKIILNNLSRRITLSNKIILCTDYDGTLVKIKKTPSLAILSKPRFELLKRLADNSNINLVIVSGRSHNSLNSLVPIKNVTIISNHGFRISSAQFNWIHPGVSKIFNTMRRVYPILKCELNIFEGVFVEDKEITLTLHYRNVNSNLIRGIKTKVNEIIKQYSKNLKITTGKKILEIRPDIAWNKGLAVNKFLAGNQLEKDKNLIIYIGDDKTDEDAFGILHDKALTIKVGKSKNTSAGYYLLNVNDVYKLLKLMETIRNNGIRK